MGFTPDMIAAVRGDSQPEIDILIAANRPGSAGNSDMPVLQSDRSPEPDRLFDISRLNKMLGWLPVSPSLLPPTCVGLAPRLLQARMQTARMNRHAMTVTAEVAANLTRAGIRHVVLKGPFQQMIVHDDPFRRPSGDIDLYVAPRDRKPAAAALQQMGFTPIEQDQSLWWVSFLGEQHFRRKSDGAVIDLHHRLQQAGLPDWRGAEDVLDRADSVTHEGVLIPVLSPIDGCLLIAVSLAKALLAHEPCGWAATELTHWMARLDPTERAVLTKVATRSGQDQTLALGITLAHACGEHPGLAIWPPAVLPGLPTDPKILRDLVFQPWQRESEAPRRRQMLRMLARGRPHILAFEAMRAVLSLKVKAALERQTSG